MLLAILLVSLTGSAFGAGTFASFNATVTNDSNAFVTGSLVLTAQKTSGNLCYSNGTTASNGGTGTATDTNANTACDSLFTLDLQKPGVTSTINTTITNAGSLAAANGLLAYSPTTCTAIDRVGESYKGTGNMCEAAMLSIQLSDASACYYGGGAATTISGTAVVTGLTAATQSGTTTIGSTSDNLRVTIDSVNYDATIANASYGFSTTGSGTLAAALRAAFASHPVLIGVGVDGKVYISSTVPGAHTISVANWNGDTSAVSNLGLTSTSSAGVTAACTYDPAHSVANFAAKYTSSSAALTVATTLAAGANKVFTVGFNLDTAAANIYQGRGFSNFGITWYES
jgi:hypothetical protein